MVKVYELARYDAMTIRISYRGQTIMTNFSGGNGHDKRAKLITASIFVQDAIEHDPRFNHLIYLVDKYDDTPAAAVEAQIERDKPKKITKVKTVNDALLYFTKLGENVTADSSLEDFMVKHNVEFPNLRR